MSPHGAAHCGQTEAGPSLGRGEEGMKDARQIFFADAAAICQRVRSRLPRQILDIPQIAELDCNPFVVQE